MHRSKAWSFGPQDKECHLLGDDSRLTMEHIHSNIKERQTSWNWLYYHSVLLNIASYRLTLHIFSSCVNLRNLILPTRSVIISPLTTFLFYFLFSEIIHNDGLWCSGTAVVIKPELFQLHPQFHLLTMVMPSINLFLVLYLNTFLWLLNIKFLRPLWYPSFCVFFFTVAISFVM